MHEKIQSKTSTNLVEFVGKSCNARAEFLDAVDDDGANGGSCKRLVVDDVDFLGKHVEDEPGAQHVGS